MFLNFSRLGGGLFGGLALVGLAALGPPGAQTGEAPKSPYVVKIQKEKATEAELPVDPKERIHWRGTQPLHVQISSEQYKNLHLGHSPFLNIDGKVILPGLPTDKVDTVKRQLPKDADGKQRRGYVSVSNYKGFLITMTVEMVPSKAPGASQERQLAAVLIRYQVENKNKVSLKFGLRVQMDCYLIDEENCSFTAPTHPGKLIEGVELKDDKVPDYLQILQRPNLKDPGCVTTMTLNLGSAIEKPNRLLLTQHGVMDDEWNMMVTPSNGGPSIGIYWDPKEIQPGGKRYIGYAYGTGIADHFENRVHINFGGSFEPGKLFTIQAMAVDPSPGMSLVLELPKGMERVEGKEIQPVPLPQFDQSISFVLWKARVTQTGTFPIRIRSNTGHTQTKVVTVSKAGE